MPSVLIAGLGARGGVGRSERLMTAALDAAGLRSEGLWRRAHPSYLDTPAAPGGRGQRVVAGLPRFCAAYCARMLRRRPSVVLFTHVNLARVGLFNWLLPFAPPYVVVAHGEEVWTRLPAIKRIALRRAQAVIAVSSHTKRLLCEAQGVSADRVRVVNLSLEEGAFPPVAGGAPEPGRLLSVARLERVARDKGIDLAIAALPAIAARHPDARYTVIGTGDDAGYLEDCAERAGVADRVDLRGELTQAELLAEYARASVFVLPSQREGFGLVFLEAMSFSKPVVAWKAGGTTDVVADGETGLLVTSEQELVDAVCGLLEDPGRAREMGEAGRRRAAQRFSFERFQAELAEVLERAASRTSPSSSSLKRSPE